jgi:hypothetical protein
MLWAGISGGAHLIHGVQPERTMGSRLWGLKGQFKKFRGAGGQRLCSSVSCLLIQRSAKAIGHLQTKPRAYKATLRHAPATKHAQGEASGGRQVLRSTSSESRVKKAHTNMGALMCRSHGPPALAAEMRPSTAAGMASAYRSEGLAKGGAGAGELGGVAVYRRWQCCP